MRTHTSSHLSRAALLLAVLATAWPARATDLHITLPALVAAPGSTMVVPIDVTPGPAGLDIFAMDFSMPLDPAVIASSVVKTEGFLRFWGPPFVNGTSTVVAGAAAGLTPVTTTNPRMCTLLITVKPTAVPGAVMPLAFSTVRFNEGTPSVSVTTGSLTVTSALGAPFETGGGTLELLAPRPNPAHGVLRAGVNLANPGFVRLTLHDTQGRLVRELASGELPAGTREYRWDGRDAQGRALPAGVYLLRASAPGAVRVRRVVWLP